MLYTGTERNVARLDWFEDEESFCRKKKVRKTIYCEDIRQLAPHKVDGRHSFQLEMTNNDKPQTFAANNRAELESWLKAFEDARKRKKSVSSSKPDQKSSLTNPVYDEDDSEYKENTLYESVDSSTCKFSNQLKISLMRKFLFFKLAIPSIIFPLFVSSEHV